MIKKQAVMKFLMVSITMLLSYSASPQISGTGAPVIFSNFKNTGPVTSTTTYHIHPDNSYTRTFLLTNKWQPNCPYIIYAEEAGTVSMQGGKFIFEQKSSRSTGRDNCITENNWEKNLPLKTESYIVLIDKDGAGVWIILTGADGRRTRYQLHTE